MKIESPLRRRILQFEDYFNFNETLKPFQDEFFLLSLHLKRWK